MMQNPLFDDDEKIENEELKVNEAFARRFEVSWT